MKQDLYFFFVKRNRAPCYIQKIYIYVLQSVQSHQVISTCTSTRNELLLFTSTTSVNEAATIILQITIIYNMKALIKSIELSDFPI